jgi:hypothetical protein
MALASRLLIRAALRLLGLQQVAWAQAMQAELAAVGDEREALAFAWGCLSAALGHSFMAARSGLAQAQNAGVLACSTAVLLGCVFTRSAGAPGPYLWMNLLSLPCNRHLPLAAAAAFASRRGAARQAVFRDWGHCC